MTTISLKPKQPTASPRLMLSDFADVVSKSGSPKATKVAQVKHRDEYTPATDFYKALREGIIELHQQGGEKKDLKQILSKIPDQKKQVNYPDAVAGYQKWWGRKKLEWFKPPVSSYTHQGIEVLVNPELGLLIDGKPHIVKLYFKGDKLIKSRANIITGLMELTLREHAPEGAIISILDVRNAKAYSFTEEDMNIFHAMVDAELSYVATMWDKV